MSQGLFVDSKLHTSGAIRNEIGTGILPKDVTVSRIAAAAPYVSLLRTTQKTAIVVLSVGCSILGGRIPELCIRGAVTLRRTRDLLIERELDRETFFLQTL